MTETGHVVRRVLPATVLAAVILVLYAPTVRNGFVSDAYLFLGMAASGRESVLASHGGYHYYPLSVGVFFLQYALWGLEPSGFHWTAIALHVVTSLLVVRLGRSLELSAAVSWSAAFLFATNGLIHEVPLWAIGAFYSLSTCLYVGALLAYLDHVRTARRRSLVAMLILLAGALLAHEQSVTLIPVFGLAAVLVAARLASIPRMVWWRRAKELLPAVGVLAGYFVLKLALSDGTDLAPGLWESPFRRVGPFALHLLRVIVPNLSKTWAWQALDPSLPSWAANLSRAALVALVGVGCMRLSPRLRFLALWTALHVGVMVLAIGMASRHYYLPLVPASLLIASLLARAAETAAEWLGPTRIRPGAERWVLPLLVAPLLFAGLTTVTFRKAVWAEAAALSENLIRQMAEASQAAPAARALYVVDLPDGLPLGESDPAYVFRLGLEDALTLRRIGPFPTITRLHSHPPARWKEPYGRPATEYEIAALAADPANLVLRYDPDRRRLDHQSLGEPAVRR